MTEFERYLNYKLIISFINDDEILETKKSYNSIIFTEEFIVCMDVFCELYIDENCLDKTQVSRFSDLLHYVRMNGNLKKECIPLINKMILSINKTDYSRYYEFCVENYMCRFKGHDFFRFITRPSDNYEMVKKVKESASKDYYFLMLLTKFSEEEFEKYMDATILNEYFLLSVNQLIAEFPGLLDNEIFVQRLKKIMSLNISQIDKVEDKKEKKIIFKESKFYFRHL